MRWKCIIAKFNKFIKQHKPAPASSRKVEDCHGGGGAGQMQHRRMCKRKAVPQTLRMGPLLQGMLYDNWQQA